MENFHLKGEIFTVQAGEAVQNSSTDLSLKETHKCPSKLYDHFTHLFIFPLPISRCYWLLFQAVTSHLITMWVPLLYMYKLVSG